MAPLRLVAALGLCALAGALDAKWTPNGEAPAPFSTKAREQMGIDPSQFAGGAPAPASGGGSTLKLGMGMLAAIYLANNWNVAVALQGFLLKLLGPLLASMRDSQAQKARAADAALADDVRKARASRLRDSKVKRKE